MSTKDRIVTRDAKAGVGGLIEEGRKHDAAMTTGEWLADLRPDEELVRDLTGYLIADCAVSGLRSFIDRNKANAAGITWMRNNLHRLLTALTAAQADTASERAGRIAANSAAKENEFALIGAKAREKAERSRAELAERELKQVRGLLAGADAREKRLREALVLVLPLAKGYAPDGQTTDARATCRAWIETAEAALPEPQAQEGGDHAR